MIAHASMVGPEAGPRIPAPALGSTFDPAAYAAFLRTKIASAPGSGFEVQPQHLHPSLYPVQRDATRWALRGGRRAIFKSFGLGKTRDALEIARQVLRRAKRRKEEGRALIVFPLGVRTEFVREAAAMGIPVVYVTCDAEAHAAPAEAVLLTNYERVREGHLSPDFLASLLLVVLDEASVLRSFGSKTYQLFTELFAAVPYRMVLTATPAPNRLKELIHYAGFLGIMDTGQALTRWFKRNSSKAGDLTLMEHKAREFWLWVASWGLFVTKPSDLGHSDEGYDLPPLDVQWHCVDVAHVEAGEDSWGQGKMFRDAAEGVSAASREKRDTIEPRIAKMQEIMEGAPANEDGTAPRWIVWHDLEAEREAIERAWAGEIATGTAATAYGKQDLGEREAVLEAFAEGRWQKGPHTGVELMKAASKPILWGSGTNLQRGGCSRAVFLGVGYKFNDFIQAVHRIYRFQQRYQVTIHIIYCDSEVEVVRELRRKWREHDELLATMTEIVRTYGLSDASKRLDLERTIGVERQEVRGRRFTAVLNDSVPETASMASDSIDFGMTSVPFGNQYEYTPSYNDFGHSQDLPQFLVQMDFLIPELYRIHKPGRIFAVHVKDRILFGKVTGRGVPTVQRFSDKMADAFEKHGWDFMGRITITTDVVRENNQTYRLTWSEMAKDATKMGVGMSEYLLIFHKPQSDLTRGYADERVTHDKSVYTLAPWQLDAHGYWRSSGNRLLTQEELLGMEMHQIAAWWKVYNTSHVYDYHQHVGLCRFLEEAEKLSKEFMLMPPHSVAPDVWTDVTRMRTLNSEQSRARLENHVCPLQFDTVERAIERWSNPGDLVLDPFGGLMTVPYVAVQMGRRGIGIELNPGYWQMGTNHCRGVEAQALAPTLFDALGDEVTAPLVPQRAGAGGL